MQGYHPSANLQDALVGLQPKRGEGGRRPFDRHMLLPVAEHQGRTGMGRIEDQLIAVLAGKLPPQPLQALQSGDE